MKQIIFYTLLLLATACKKSASPALPAPTSKISVENVTQLEGNNGTANFTIKVTLDQASSKTVSVAYATVEGTAKGGEDFTAVTSGALTFQPNEVQKTISVSVVADDKREPDETFTVVLSGATNATIQQSIGLVTIVNDDTRLGFTNAGYDAPTTYAGYTLAWSDEFNGSSLNTAIWSHQNGDGCPNLCGWGNNELEYYTSRPENLFFQDGKMIIEARQEGFNGRQYTSSKIVTAGKKTLKFGRIDVRALLPIGKGIWPAFWLLPQDNVYGGWPKSGEIDLMEYLGHEPNKVHGTLHFGPGPGSIQITRFFTLPGNGSFNNEFHVFSLEWKQDQLKFFVDNNLYSTVNRSDVGGNIYPFNEQFYLIFNLAVGGQWPGNPDATTTFPQWLIVDYVRVYQ